MCRDPKDGNTMGVVCCCETNGCGLTAIMSCTQCAGPKPSCDENRARLRRQADVLVAVAAITSVVITDARRGSVVFSGYYSVVML